MKRNYIVINAWESNWTIEVEAEDEFEAQEIGRQSNNNKFNIEDYIALQWDKIDHSIEGEDKII